MAIFGKKENTEQKLPENLPKHIAFIMDGNGRWAKKRGLPRTMGHIEGAKTFRKITRYCKDIGIKYVSFYAFSTENWKRPPEEISGLMKLFDEYLDDIPSLLSENTKLVFLGDKSAFTPELREKMDRMEQVTADCNEMTMLMAVNYGGRDELRRAAIEIAKKAKDGSLDPDSITEDTISGFLDTAGIPDVDLMIRPSGELRLSNFLIWQCAYAEYYFTDILWPDFSPEDLKAALIDFEGRHRRFGCV